MPKNQLTVTIGAIPVGLGKMRPLSLQSVIIDFLDTQILSATISRQIPQH